MKKLLSVVFAAVMLLTMTVIVGAAEVTQLAGTGDFDDPYQIGTLDELKWFRDDVNGGNDYKGKYVVLTNDIDISGETDWTPIGNASNVFAGYFNGKGKTVSGLTITSAPDHSGFFGMVNKQAYIEVVTPVIQNLNLTNVSVKGGKQCGGLAGQVYVGKVINVSVSGNITGGSYVGGLVGHVYATFEDCSFEGTVTGVQAGGIAGAGDCKAHRSSVVGDVSGTWVGGIVGNGQEGTSAVDCYVKGQISAGSNYSNLYGVGGIAGMAGHGYSNSVFSGNYFDGEVLIAGEKIDTPIIGVVNAANGNIQTTVEGNSWNTEKYPADLVVHVVGADTLPENATMDDYVATAKESLPRNNNIVGSISDVQYIESGDVTIVGDTIDADDITNELGGNEQFDITFDPDTGAATVVKYVAKIGDAKQTDLKTAIESLKDNDTLTIFAGTHEIGAVKLPNGLENVTIQGAPDKVAIIKNSTIMASDGSSVSYTKLTFDGIVFDNSNLVLGGSRSEVTYKDITIKNCEFKNIVNEDGLSAIHMHVNPSTETVENFTFTNNIIDGISGGSNSGVYISAVKGTVTIENNVIKNVAWNAIQIKNSTADTELFIEGNTFENAQATGQDGIVNLFGIVGDVRVADNTMTESFPGQLFFCYVGEKLNEDGFVYGGTFYGSDTTLKNYVAKSCGLFEMAPGEYAVAANTTITVTFNGFESFNVPAGTVLSEYIPDNDGYELVGWYTDEELLSKYDFSRPFIVDTTLYPCWKDDKHDVDTGYVMIIMKMLKKLDISVEIIEADGGKIVVVVPEKVKYNKPAVCTVIPDEGYAVKDVIVDGESVGAVTEYTIEKLKGKHTITAVFEKLADTDANEQ